MVTFTLSIGALALITFYYLYKRKYGKYRYPPGPTPIPILGNALQLDASRFHLTFAKWAKQYGHMMTVTLANKIVVINDTELIKDVLIRRANEFSDRAVPYRAGSLSQGRGIGQAEFTPQLKEKKKLALKSLKMYGDGLAKLEEISQEVMEDYFLYLDKLDGQPSCFNTDIYAAVANVITSMILGHKFEFNDQDMLDFKANLELNIDSSSRLSGVIFDLCPWLRHIIPSKVMNDSQSACDGLLAFMNKYLTPIKNNVDPSDISCFAAAMYQHHVSPPKGHTTPFRDDHDYTMTNFDLLFAGYSTTSIALSSLVTILMHYPEVERCLLDEIHSVIGTDRFPSIADKSRMPYTNAVIMELLRYIAHIPQSIPHKTSKDVEIGGYSLPKGTEIWINLWYLHHDERLWEKPWSFIPERFLDPSTGDLKPPGDPVRQNLMPFGAGPRFCLGETLAKNRMFLFICAILQRYKLVPPEGKDPPICDPRQYIGNFLIQPQSYTVRALKRL